MKLLIERSTVDQLYHSVFSHYVHVRLTLCSLFLFLEKLCSTDRVSSSFPDNVTLVTAKTNAGKISGNSDCLQSAHGKHTGLLWNHGVAQRCHNTACRKRNLIPTSAGAIRSLSVLPMEVKMFLTTLCGWNSRYASE